MNDAKHTKGPWEIGEWITSQSHAVYKLIHGAGRNVSAVCVYGARKDGTKSGKRNVSVEECDANARLIAAAPDLLEACKAAFRALPGSADAIAIQCQFAIAKAEGTNGLRPRHALCWPE